MQDLTASRTALATSLVRAAHTRLDPHPLINDPWGDRLVPDSVRELRRGVALSGLDADARAEAMNSPATIVGNYLLASAAYSNVIIRTRYTEDALQAAIARGIRQYVLIGAGFDSFGLRADLARHSVAESLLGSPFRSDQPAFFQLAKTVASMGEPFISGFDPTTLATDLRGCGLTPCEDLDMQDAAARYGRDDLKNEAGPSRFSHVALARVGM